MLHMKLAKNIYELIIIYLNALIEFWVKQRVTHRESKKPKTLTSYDRINVKITIWSSNYKFYRMRDMFERQNEKKKMMKLLL